MVIGTCLTVWFLILQFLEPGNDRTLLEVDTEDQDADEVLNVDDNYDEILDYTYRWHSWISTCILK